MSSQVDVRPPLEPIRRFGALGFFVFTVGSLLFSAGEQALYYTPAEVTFLFAGPYRKRQLLAYKLVVTVLLCLFSALFFTLASKVMSPHLASAMVGSFLVILFLQVLQMVVGLAAATLGALAWSRGRRLVLVGVVVLIVGLAALSAGRGLLSAGPMEASQTIERSPVATAVLAPFRWFIMAFTAERAWPDLIGWAGAGLDGRPGLAGPGLRARRGLPGGGGDLQRPAIRPAPAARRGRGRRPVDGDPTPRPVPVPAPGAAVVGRCRPQFLEADDRRAGRPGPDDRASRRCSRSMPIVMISVIGPEMPSQMEAMPYVCMGMIGWTSVFLSLLIPYDFRGDIVMMEELKTLPIAPTRLAMGQVLTPTLLANTSQAVAVVTVIARVGMSGAGAWWSGRSWRSSCRSTSCSTRSRTCSSSGIPRGSSPASSTSWRPAG